MPARVANLKGNEPSARDICQCTSVCVNIYAEETAIRLDRWEIKQDWDQETGYAPKSKVSKQSNLLYHLKVNSKPHVRHLFRQTTLRADI